MKDVQKTSTAGHPRVTLAGCGGWGKNLARNLKDLGVLSAICDVDTEAARQLAAVSDVPVLPSLRYALADPDIDAVFIATPAATHGAMVRNALEAGKHVFVEKPLALDVAEAEDLVRLAKTKDLTLMVGHLLQYHPAFLALRDIVAEGGLGRLQYIYSHRLNLGKIRQEENILWSFAPHDVSMILQLAGEEPTRIEATGSQFLQERVADVTVTMMEFARGLRAHIFVSWLHPYKEQKLIVVGDKGMAVFDDTHDWDEKLVLYPHTVEWRDGQPIPKKADGRPVKLTRKEPLREECLHFLDSCRDRTPPRTDGAEGVRVLRVLDAAQKAMEGRKAIDLMAKTRAFFVHPTAVVDDDVDIGAGTKIWHFTHLLGGTRVGRNCILGQNVMAGPNVTIGDGCKIQNNVSLYPGVTLSANVFCGPSCVFTNVSTPRAHVERKNEFLPTPVGEGASIGANATIVCGHRIGAFAMIGAGAVVTKDVPAHALMVGNPARRIGWVSRTGDRLNADLTCPRTGERYAETPDGRLERVEGSAA